MTTPAAASTLTIGVREQDAADIGLVLRALASLLRLRERYPEEA